MSTNPTATISSVLPGVTAGESGLKTIIPMLQIAKGGWDMLDAARRGRISQGIGGALNLYGGYQGLTKPSGVPSSKPAESQSATTQSKFGMSQSEFMALDPQLRERMLKQLMGR